MNKDFEQIISDETVDKVNNLEKAIAKLADTIKKTALLCGVTEKEIFEKFNNVKNEQFDEV